MNSSHIKASLMSYYRFKRGFICAEECRCTGSEISDILVDTGTEIIDIEIKISKADLIKGEARKSKHYSYKNLSQSNKYYKKYYPNKFFICVPADLKSIAEQWVKDTNPLYGIIIYNPPYQWRSQINFERNLHFIKNAKSFNSVYSDKYFKEIMAKRLSSSVTNTMQKSIIKKEKNYG